MLPALMLGLAGLIAAVALLLQSASLRAGPVAVVFPPYFSTLRMADAIGRAGGILVRDGGLPGVLIARSGDRDFAERLHRQGAWLVLDPILAGGCLWTRPRRSGRFPS